MPPLADTLAVPLEPPLQLVGVALQVAVTPDRGPPTIDSHVAVHPLLSVTVTVYVPEVNPPIEDVVAVVLHK